MSQWCKEVSNRKRAEGNITYVFACRCYVYLVEELVGTMNAALENFDVLGVRKKPKAHQWRHVVCGIVEDHYGTKGFSFLLL